MALGTDIVKISRMESVIFPEFPRKIFTENEIAYINTKNNKAQTSAGIFAAKEAVLKAFGKGITLPLNQVEILHLEGGAPRIKLLGAVADFAGEKGFEEVEISISHDGEYAIACAYARINNYALCHQKALFKLKNCPRDTITPELIAPLLPKRKSDSHKGTYGRLYIVAGSLGLTGAAIMASKASLICGAGLISLACPKELNTIFETALTEVMTKPIPSREGLISLEGAEDILKNVSASDLCLIGPGLGRGDEITKIVQIVIENTSKPIVADADGLNAISHNTEILKKCKAPVIITPHIGEFAALTGMDIPTILENPQMHALAFARRYNTVVVLKSHNTVVASPDGRICVNRLGNPGMATGGSGDVLSGAVASFAVQGIDPFEAALLGVYIHSLAADMASFEKGEYSLTPGDILEYIPYAIKYTQAKGD